MSLEVNHLTTALPRPPFSVFPVTAHDINHFLMTVKPFIHSFSNMCASLLPTSEIPKGHKLLTLESFKFKMRQAGDCESRSPWSHPLLDLPSPYVYLTFVRLEAEHNSGLFS